VSGIHVIEKHADGKAEADELKSFYYGGNLRRRMREMQRRRDWRR